MSPPSTGTGLVRLVVVPSPSAPPSCPLKARAPLAPQQYAAPPVVTPQVCAFPTLTAAKLRPPATSTGLNRPRLVPSPCWPKTLRPQQYAAPAAVTPQVCSPPALRA